MFTQTAKFRLSFEAQNAKASIIRSLIGHAVDPDMISFAAGLPAGELLPVKEYQQCLADVLSRDGALAMQYGPQYMPLREWIAVHMRSRGVSCEPEHLFITNGSQQSLTILSRLFLDPGQPTVVEEATFTGINLVTAGRGADVRTIPTDLTTGADMDALEAALSQSTRPQMAVLIPDFHNPLGVSLTNEKRKRAAQLANQYVVPLIEDDPYSLLRFSGQMLPPIKSFDNGGYVFYLGSFSKILAPGLRLGWIVVPPELWGKITVIREAIDLETSALTQRAVAQFLQRGLLEPHLERMNQGNRVRCHALLDALHKHMRDMAVWTEPEGGLFVWVRLHDVAINTLDVLKDAVANHVVYIPGAAFTASGEGMMNALRLNFSNVPPEKMNEGIRRLAVVLQKRSG